MDLKYFHYREALIVNGIIVTALFTVHHKKMQHGIMTLGDITAVRD